MSLRPGAVEKIGHLLDDQVLPPVQVRPYAGTTEIGTLAREMGDWERYDHRRNDSL